MNEKNERQNHAIAPPNVSSTMEKRKNPASLIKFFQSFHQIDEENSRMQIIIIKLMFGFVDIASLFDSSNIPSVSPPHTSRATNEWTCKLKLSQPGTTNKC